MASVARACGATAGHYPALGLLEATPLPTDGHLVLVVVDGLGYHYLRSAPGVALMQASLRGSMTSVFPSTTATAVTAFLTGVPAQQHGLTGWHMHLDEVGQSVAILPYETRAGAQSLARLGVEPASLFPYPTFFQGLAVQSHAVSPDTIARSVFNRWHTRGASVAPYRSLTQCFEIVERLCRAQHQRQFIYVYLPDFDACAHERGIASRLTAAHLQRFAQALERLLRSLAGAGVTLMVTADHGFVDLPAQQRLELDQFPELAQCLSGPLTGERRLPYCHVKPDAHQRFETLAAEALGHACEVVPSQTLIDQHYFGLGQPHPQLARRAGDYTLLMKPGYSLKDWLPDEKKHTLIGVHGGLTEEEMLVPLMLFNP